MNEALRQAGFAFRFGKRWHKFSHGTRARYSSGCRCNPCRRANREYERYRIAARRDGDFNGLVDAKPVRQHIIALSKQGIGRRTIERLAGVGSTVVSEVRKGRKLLIRARTAKKILAVDARCKPAVFNDLGRCEPCWQKKKHICLASKKVDGVPKCDGCATGTKCRWHAGSGWFRGDGTKGRPKDLRSTKELAKNHAHGTKMRYLAGCRCKKCRAAEAEYAARLKENRRLYGPNDLVLTEEVRAHLLHLQSWGIGYQTVARALGIGKTSLGRIIWPGNRGEKKLIRRRTANAVLSFKPMLEHFPRNRPVPAGETLDKLRLLIRWGIPRGTIAIDCLDNDVPALQMLSRPHRSPVVLVKKALAVRDYFARVATIREMWIKLHGKIPPRHYVYWKPGRHGLTIRSFELRRFAVTYDYHVLWPKELKEVSALRNKLQNAYRAKKRGQSNGEEQNHRSTRPLVRDHRTTQGRKQADGHRPRKGDLRRGQADHRQRQGRG